MRNRGERETGRRYAVRGSSHFVGIVEAIALSTGLNMRSVAVVRDWGWERAARQSTKGRGFQSRGWGDSVHGDANERHDKALPRGVRSPTATTRIKAKTRHE